MVISGLGLLKAWLLVLLVVKKEAPVDEFLRLRVEGFSRESLNIPLEFLTIGVVYRDADCKSLLCV